MTVFDTFTVNVYLVLNTLYVLNIFKETFHNSYFWYDFGMFVFNYFVLVF